MENYLLVGWLSIMYNVIDRRLSHAALIVQGYECPHLSVQFESFFFF